jgi:hypothetical protein
LVATKGRDRSIGFIIIKNRELKRNRKRRGEGRGGEKEKVMLTLRLYFQYRGRDDDSDDAVDPSVPITFSGELSVAGRPPNVLRPNGQMARPSLR